MGYITLRIAPPISYTLRPLWEATLRHFLAVQCATYGLQYANFGLHCATYRLYNTPPMGRLHYVTFGLYMRHIWAQYAPYGLYKAPHKGYSTPPYGLYKAPHKGYSTPPIGLKRHLWAIDYANYGPTYGLYAPYWLYKAPHGLQYAPMMYKAPHIGCSTPPMGCTKRHI